MASEEKVVSDFRTCRDCGFHTPKEAFCRSKQRDNGNGRIYVVYRNKCRKCWSKYCLSRRDGSDLTKMKDYIKHRQQRAKYKVVSKDEVRYFQILRCAEKYANKVNGVLTSIKQGDKDASS